MASRKKFAIPRLDSIPAENEIQELLDAELAKGSRAVKVCAEVAPTDSDENTKRAEELRRLSEPAKYFADLAPIWRAELERLLRASGLRLNVVKALNELELHYHGLSRFYRDHSRDFEALLDGRVFIVEPNTKRAAFFHRDHPDLGDVAPGDAFNALNFAKSAVNTEPSFNAVATSSTRSFEPSNVPEFTPSAASDKSVFFTKTKMHWKKEIASVVAEYSGKCDAHILLTRLEENYQGITDFFYGDRKTFERLFENADIALISEEAGEYFYSRRRPEIDPTALDEFQVLMGESVRVNTAKQEKRPAKRVPAIAKRVVSANGTKSNKTFARKNADPNATLVTRFTANADAWLDALEHYLQKNDLRAPVLDALETLNDSFSGITDLYLFYPKVLEELVQRRGVFFDDSDGGEYFYHKDSPEFKPLSTREAAKRLDVGSQAPKRASSIEIAEDVVLRKAESFDDVGLLAEMTSRQCDWAVERQTILALGGNYDSSVRAVDNEIMRNANKYDMFLWTVHIPLGHEQLRNLARCYELLARCARTLQRILDDRSLFPPTLCRRAFLTTSKAQCLVKSVLIDYNIKIGCDRAQYAASERLREFADENYGDRMNAPLDLKDRVALDSFDELSLEFQRIRGDYVKLASQFDGKKRAFERLTAIARRVAEADVVNLYDWNALNEKVAELCRDYDVKPSASKLREILRELVDRIPDELDKSDELCDVVQQIELYEQQRLERAESVNVAREKVASRELAAVRRYLDGKKVVFIGGTPQDHMRQRWERELNAEIVWEPCSHGHSLDRFGSSLRDPDVLMFMVYIPWCSHKHSEEFAPIVQDAGKDIVRLRKGTSPDQIACSICDQVSVFID